MNIASSIMHFREQRASELDRMAGLIAKHIGGNLSSIYNASSQLRNKNYIPVLKDGSVNPNLWGYEIEDFTLPIDTLEHVRPTLINKAELTLNLKLVANVNEWENLSDPLCELNFKVDIKGSGDKIYHQGFHIDRHDMTLNSTNPHPIYHLQHSANPRNLKPFDYGSVMCIDTPRIMHFPMDFILGVGFLTSNFFPAAFELLINDPQFVKLYKEYQERIWKPYSHSLAHHWKPFQVADITWQPASELCPLLI